MFEGLSEGPRNLHLVVQDPWVAHMPPQPTQKEGEGNVYP